MTQARSSDPKIPQGPTTAPPESFYVIPEEGRQGGAGHRLRTGDARDATRGGGRVVVGVENGSTGLGARS
jgi:hypothetical protein